MNIDKIRKLLENESNDIEDRLEDLVNGYKTGTVDEVIEQQQEDLEKINKLLKFIGEL